MRSRHPDPADYLRLAAEYDAQADERRAHNLAVERRAAERKERAERRWDSWYGRLALGLLAVPLLASLLAFPALYIGTLVTNVPWTSPWPYVVAAIVALVLYAIELERRR